MDFSSLSVGTTTTQSVFVRSRSSASCIPISIERSNSQQNNRNARLLGLHCSSCCSGPDTIRWCLNDRATGKPLSASTVHSSLGAEGLLPLACSGVHRGKLVGLATCVAWPVLTLWSNWLRGRIDAARRRQLAETRDRPGRQRSRQCGIAAICVEQGHRLTGTGDQISDVRGYAHRNWKLHRVRKPHNGDGFKRKIKRVLDVSVALPLLILFFPWTLSRIKPRGGGGGLSDQAYDWKSAATSTARVCSKSFLNYDTRMTAPQRTMDNACDDP